MRKPYVEYILEYSVGETISRATARYCVKTGDTITKKRFNACTKYIAKCLKQIYKFDVLLVKTMYNNINSEIIIQFTVKNKIYFKNFLCYLYSTPEQLDHRKNFLKFNMYKSYGTIRKEYLKEVEKFIEK